MRLGWERDPGLRWGGDGSRGLAEPALAKSRWVLI